MNTTSTTPQTPRLKAKRKRLKGRRAWSPGRVSPLPAAPWGMIGLLAWRGGVPGLGPPALRCGDVGGLSLLGLPGIRGERTRPWQWLGCSASESEQGGDSQEE
jgi:hypothetical protein